jgi:uncharacterized protein
MRCNHYLKAIFLLLVAACLLCSSCQRSSPYIRSRTATLVFGKVEMAAEIAYTAEEKSRGLMNRTSLEENKGMLFAYDTEERPSFWMKNTLIPLSIAFIDSHGLIVKIADMEPGSRSIITSEVDVLFALETNRGWFQKHKIKAGDTMTVKVQR